MVFGKVNHVYIDGLINLILKVSKAISERMEILMILNPLY